MFIFYGMYQNSYVTLDHDMPLNIPLIPCIVLIHTFPVVQACVYTEKLLAIFHEYCPLRTF